MTDVYPLSFLILREEKRSLRYMQKRSVLAEDIDFNKVARMASGASGAELANIVNEAALRAVRDNRKYATPVRPWRKV